ncbi:MAG TPA: phosphatase, partial [Opitutaceae bacterium]|nr:phosphatase [Opitutaceae bacterium]
DPTAPFSAEARAATIAHVQHVVAESGFNFNLAGAPAVFTGGSMTTTRAIFASQRGENIYQTSPIVPVVELGTLLDRSAPLPLSERKKIPGLPPARADVFPTALATVVAVAGLAKVKEFQHSFCNLRWGVAAEALGRLGTS